MGMRPGISAVVITYNAAQHLAACLASLHFVDEIVVLDAGSSDGTELIAKQYGVRWEVNPWIGFGPQKRHAVALARHDWVLCIDADERLSQNLALAICSTLNDARYSVYRMPRSNYFMGRYLRHGEGYPDWSVRLFDRRAACWSEDLVHEKVVTTKPVGTVPGRDGILHHSADDLAVYLDKQNRYTSLQAAALFQAGVRGSRIRLVVSPLLRFLKFYVLRLGWMDGLPGFVHITIGCMGSFNKYAKLYALQQEEN